MHSLSLAAGEEDRVPALAHRTSFRRVATEIQHRTVAGGWATIAVADDPDWAASITAALNWLKPEPVFEFDERDLP